LLALSSFDYQFPHSITSPDWPLLHPSASELKIPPGLSKQAAMTAIFRWEANQQARGPRRELKHFGPRSRNAGCGRQWRISRFTDE